MPGVSDIRIARAGGSSRGTGLHSTAPGVPGVSGIHIARERGSSRGPLTLCNTERVGPQRDLHD